MSLYRFIASDKEMPEYTNTNNYINIEKEEDMLYVKKYTDKEFVNYVEFHYTDENAQEIIDYIKNLLNDRFAVLLYNTWENDKSPLNLKSINIKDLSVKDIKDIWGAKMFKNNECLKVYKVYKEY